MKATLQFNLPEDDHEFKMATTGANMHSVLWEMDQWLRAQYKYMPDDAPEGAYDAYFKSREKLFEILNEDGLKLD